MKMCDYDVLNLENFLSQDLRFSLSGPVFLVLLSKVELTTALMHKFFFLAVCSCLFVFLFVIG